jgi:hypothetical protein
MSEICSTHTNGEICTLQLRYHFGNLDVNARITGLLQRILRIRLCGYELHSSGSAYFPVAGCSELEE